METQNQPRLPFFAPMKGASLLRRRDQPAPTSTQPPQACSTQACFSAQQKEREFQPPEPRPLFQGCTGAGLALCAGPASLPLPLPHATPHYQQPGGRVVFLEHTEVSNLLGVEASEQRGWVYSSQHPQSCLNPAMIFWGLKASGEAGGQTSSGRERFHSEYCNLKSVGPTRSPVISMCVPSL